jgi:hypothetical protein
MAKYRILEKGNRGFIAQEMKWRLFGWKKIGTTSCSLEGAKEIINNRIEYLKAECSPKPIIHEYNPQENDN